MAASGPGATNLITGVANALIDCAPLLALGGSSPISQFGRQTFQEIDQVAIISRSPSGPTRARPEAHPGAGQHRAAAGDRRQARPGLSRFARRHPVPRSRRRRGRLELCRPAAVDPRPRGDPRRSTRRSTRWRKAKQPLIVIGSGILWSDAVAEMQAFVETAGIPFYTTPQGRGVVPDDHALSFLTVRSTAFSEADLILVIGTRINYVIGHAAPPRFSAQRQDHPDRHRRRRDRPQPRARRHRDRRRLQGGAAAVARRLPTARRRRTVSAPWREQLAEGEGSKRERPAAAMSDRRRRRSTRCACARRCATSSIATPSWWSTGRRS